MPQPTPRRQMFPILHLSNWIPVRPGPDGSQVNRFIPRLYGMQGLDEDERPNYRPLTKERSVATYQEIRDRDEPYVVTKARITVMWPLLRDHLYFVPLSLILLVYLLFTGHFVACLVLLIVVAIGEAALVFFVELQRYWKWWSNIVLINDQAIEIHHGIYPTEFYNIEAEAIIQVEASQGAYFSWLPQRLQLGLNLGTVTIHHETTGINLSDDSGAGDFEGPNQLVLRFVQNPLAVRDTIHELQISFQQALKDQAESSVDIGHATLAVLSEIRDDQRVIKRMLAASLLTNGFEPATLIASGLDEATTGRVIRELREADVRLESEEAGAGD